MKYIIVLSIFFYSFSYIQEEFILNGKYIMLYESNHSENNCLITFKKDFYVKQLATGQKIKGNIEYQKNFINLSDEKSSLQMSLPKREIKNDTIYFRTLDSLEVIKQKKSMMLFTGKLIKVK